MKIAIQYSEGSFSEPWIKYCEENNIPHKTVNCFDSNIIEQLQDCDALMWHHHHAYYKDIQLAKPLLFSLEQAGIKVFPNFNTSWHFDNKLAQKYLLEAINAPLVKSYVFYDKRIAIEWANNTDYPKVFKLKGGAGASNVKLAKTQNDAKKLINKCFGRGWPAYNQFVNLQEMISRFRRRKESLLTVVKTFLRLLYPTNTVRFSSRQKGYAYFQEFIPNNDSDVRVIVINDKAFAIKRLVRKGDFRASGSGNIVYDKNAIDERCLQIAFETSKKLNAQCLAYAFVFDANNDPLIIEISFGFSMDAYVDCPGFWDDELNWYECQFNPYGWMISGLCSDG